MADAIIPVYYLDTNLLCRWRFLLGGNVEANMDVDDVIEKALSSPTTDPMVVTVLTRLGKDIHILSKVRVLNNIQILSVGTEEGINIGEIYGNSNYNYPTLHATLSKRGVDGAIGALVAGGIEDARRGMNYTKEYQRYIDSNVPRGYALYVNDWRYFLFDAATYLLEAIMSVKLLSTRRHRHEFFDDEDEEFSAPCSDCPFAEHCGVNLDGGKVWKRGDDISYAVGGAMYMDKKHGDGWYLLYRTAVRLLGYRTYNLKKAFKTEVKALYNEEMEEGYGDADVLVKEIQVAEKLSDKLADALRGFASDFLQGHEVYIEDDGVVDNAPLLELIKRGFVTPLYMKKEGRNMYFFRMAPGPKFMKYVWGDAK